MLDTSCRPYCDGLTMVDLLRTMVREVARLPLKIKCVVALAIVIEFAVVTQWERLPFGRTSPLVTPNLEAAPQTPEHSTASSSTDANSQSVAFEAALAKRLTRVVFDEPTVETNGTIKGNGQTVSLYGIKSFNSKNVCTKASGEKWACGLHAYATLRNLIARKRITCDPQTVLPNSVAATCVIGTTNVALTLVRDGLIELDGSAVDAEMINAQASAQNKRLGIWDR